MKNKISWKCSFKNSFTYAKLLDNNSDEKELLAGRKREDLKTFNEPQPFFKMSHICQK